MGRACGPATWAVNMAASPPITTRPRPTSSRASRRSVVTAGRVGWPSNR